MVVSLVRPKSCPSGGGSAFLETATVSSAIAPEPSELFKPLSDLLHRGRAPDYWASSARIGKITRQTGGAVGTL
jgi:hypothetical protein